MTLKIHPYAGEQKAINRSTLKCRLILEAVNAFQFDPSDVSHVTRALVHSSEFFTGGSLPVGFQPTELLSFERKFRR